MVSKKLLISLVFISLIATLVSVSPVFSATIFNNENGNAVTNATPPTPTQFTLNDYMVVTSVRTYHWNSGNGAPGGTISIKNQAGKVVYSGPVTVQSKFYWYTEPKLVFPPGTYTVNVSAPATWSYNAASGNKGFALVNADLIPADAKGPVQLYFRPSPQDLAGDTKGPVTLPKILGR
jgi:hypothetical protein